MGNPKQKFQANTFLTAAQLNELVERIEILEKHVRTLKQNGADIFCISPSLLKANEQSPIPYKIFLIRGDKSVDVTTSCIVSVLDKNHVVHDAENHTLKPQAAGSVRLEITGEDFKGEVTITISKSMA